MWVLCDCVILIIEGEMKQLIIIIGHHSKLIRTKVDAIAIDYQYIFHGILASDLTTTPEHRVRPEKAQIFLPC